MGSATNGPAKDTLAIVVRAEVWCITEGNNMLTYKELKWLQGVSDALDGDDNVRDFVLLCAQDQPELFARLVARVESGDFDVQPVDLAIQESTVKPAPSRQLYTQGGVTADLTHAQYDELHAYSGSQRNAAARRLREFLPHLSSWEAEAWAWELPNIKTYGC
jgi:hypothetical protein